MTTKWGRLRKVATEAGRDHAHGGPDRRAEFASRGTDVRDAYDSGKRNAEREMQEQAEQDERLLPLRNIRDEAKKIWTEANARDVAALARVVEELAEYLMEKES